MADSLDKPKKESGIARWFRETKGELAKVSWPTRKEAWRLTKIVLVVMLVMGVALGGLDYLFTRLVGLIVG